MTSEPNPSTCDSWSLYDLTLTSRLLLGTARYPSPHCLRQAIEASETELVTVSIRRQSPATGGGSTFWKLIQSAGVAVLPNTAGCHNVKEAVSTAHMARELFDTPRIKLEVIGDDYTLQPDPVGLVEAARILVGEGFQVFPYTTEDLALAHHLIDAGCRVIMPWASPIGSGQGVLNPHAMRTLRERIPDVPLIVDAGVGRPSEAAAVTEWGFDGVLLNTAIAEAADPVKMATAFRDAVRAGRAAHRAGLMTPRDMATPSTPTLGTPFWHQDESPEASGT